MAGRRIIAAFATAAGSALLAAANARQAPSAEPGLAEPLGTDARIIVPLRRHAVPVKNKKGEVWSHKHTYSGRISLGTRDAIQDFTVVFDTGSGHIVVPSDACRDIACQKHQQFSIAGSPSAYPVNADGKLPETTRDTVTVGYGSGVIVGDFVHDTVCLGGPDDMKEGDPRQSRFCREMSFVAATSMSAEPFETFEFDGVFGLGLASLATTDMFSFPSRLGEGGVVAQFGVYLASGDHEGSELAIAGYNSARLQTPLAWTSVPVPEQGFWQVAIKGIRVGSEELDICDRGDCRGIVDTGSSHMGVPKSHMAEFLDLLGTSAKGLTDCRLANAPNISLELAGGFSITLDPRDYMRAIPSEDAKARGPARKKKICKPRLVPLSLPKPLSRNTFIFGEPVLMRYYTVFQYEEKAPRIGFGLANHFDGAPSDQILLVQVALQLRKKAFLGFALLSL